MKMSGHNGRKYSSTAWDDLTLILAALEDRRCSLKVEQLVELCERENLFSALIDMLAESPGRRRGSISWALSRAAQKKRWCPMDRDSQLLIEQLSIEQEDMPKRCIMAIYQYCEIPEDYESQLLDLCIAFMRDSSEAIAVRAFSITVLSRSIVRYPVIFNEVKDSLYALREHESAAIRVRVKRALELAEGLT